MDTFLVLYILHNYYEHILVYTDTFSHMLSDIFYRFYHHHKWAPDIDFHILTILHLHQNISHIDWLQHIYQ